MVTRSTSHRYRLLPRFRRSTFAYLLLTMAIALWIIISPSWTIAALSSPSVQITRSATLSQQSQALYETERFTEAAQMLQLVIQVQQSQGDRLAEAVAWRNLALVYQRMAAWQPAEVAIGKSLELLQTQTGPGSLEATAQALDVRAQLQFDRGQVEQALITWEQVTQYYRQLQQQTQSTDQTLIARSSINRAEAMQAIGSYQQAIATLTKLMDTLQSQPRLQAIALRSLGNALRITRATECVVPSPSVTNSQLTRENDTKPQPCAFEVLQRSLSIEQQLGEPEGIATTLLSLAQLAAMENDPSAESYYQQAQAQATSPLTQIQAQLGLLRLWLDGGGDWATPKALANQLLSQVDRLPSDRDGIYARIHFARSLLDLAIENDPAVKLAPTAAQTILAQLEIATQQAENLGHLRAQSYAIGYLGMVYQKLDQVQQSINFTEQALKLAVASQAQEIEFLWEKQLGELYLAQGNREQAIAVYREAVGTLQKLRKDIALANPEVDFRFREDIEPIYRSLISLLLEHSPGTEPSQENLKQARETVELLQVAKLENFFGEACLNSQSFDLNRLINQRDSRTSVIYPIILADRLEVIFSLPNTETIQHYTAKVTQNQITGTTNQLLALLADAQSSQADILPIAGSFYDWLIRPAEATLANHSIETLVFVLDGELRNIPMSVLFNGERYLIEQYQIALAPSLQLLPEPSERQPLGVVMGGISQSVQGFSALPSVQNEEDAIKTEVGDRMQSLLDARFTQDSLQRLIESVPYPVVHLATHGKLGETLEDTFLLTWDGQININQLHQLLTNTNLRRNQLIELLVLSACETAAGGREAALGLAGMAIRAGARSTVATLWQVNDPATAQLMAVFYAGLAQRESKAEALRQAQLHLLQNSDYEHPYFWAAMVLIGNWQ